jgi:hypothetical protein
MTRETQRQLFQALKAHKFDLEITRSITSALDPRFWIVGLRPLGCF